MKTIFISISRGGLARNILRTGILEELIKENLKIVIIVPVKVQEYFLKEFNHANIVIESVPNFAYTKFRKFFIILFDGLVFTETEIRKIKYGGGSKNPDKKIVFLIKYLLFSFLSKFKIFKRIARFFEFNFFTEKVYDYLFEKHKPDLLFCSSIYSKLDTVLIKAAKRLKVISVSMPKSWDTVGRLFFRAPSDKIILNNEYMKVRVQDEQLIKKENIFVSGFPQFDIYKNKKVFLDHDAMCRKTGIDHQKKTVLYASEGVWTYWDDAYVDELIDEFGLNKKYNFIIRPHWSNVHLSPFKKFESKSGVYIDDQNVRITKMFGDKWDMTKENMDWLAEIINVSDVVLTTVSTFVLDAFVFNKPVINIYYDLFKKEKKNDSGVPIIPMKELYNCAHFNAVMEEKSTVLATSAGEVMSWIEKYIKDSSINYEQRRSTLNKLCYKLDGKSAKRISDFLLSTIPK